VKQLNNSGLTYWAVEEILEWALFSPYQQCVTAGVTDEALEALHVAALDLGIEDDEQSRANRRDMAQHLAGVSDKKWVKDELISSKTKATRKVFLLGVDYQRWLSQERALPPIVADEFRRLVHKAMAGMECSFGSLLVGLGRHPFDRYLAEKLGFMSLTRIVAPATIIAMRHYYDFLKELELVTAKSWKKSQSVCDLLWGQLKDAISDDQWRTFAFLEQYMPGAA
jgi:hypothetical protein